MPAPEGRQEDEDEESTAILSYKAAFTANIQYTPWGPIFKKIYRIHLHKESNLQTTKDLRRYQRSYN